MWFSTHFLAHALARLGYTDAHVSLLMLLVLILHTCLMLRKNIVFGRCQRSYNMCTLGVHGIVVFDTFSCSRTCTSWVHGCACVSADVTRLDLAHMFDATQEHRLREMSTFLQYVHTRSPRNCGFRHIFLLTHLHVLGTRMRMCLC